MRWREMLIDQYSHMFSEWEKVMEGLTTEDLHKRPAPGANPLSWLLWHCIRSSDRLLGDVVLGEQLWIKDGWHKLFNKPPDFNETGKGYTDAQVDALRIPDIQTLSAYEKAVKVPLMHYLESLDEKELERPTPLSYEPGATAPVYQRISRLFHNFQHIGAAQYVKGIIKGQGWYGR